MTKINLWVRLLNKWVQQERRILVTAFAIASCVIVLRLAGLLQSWELETLDQLYCWRPPEPDSKQVVIVEINEADLQKVKQWPIPDIAMAKLLQKIASFQPRVIGLDIYRDLLVQPGHAELLNVTRSMPNLVGIERLRDEKSLGVPPPSMLNREQVGFNNIIVDFDGKVRRSLLYWHVDGKAHKSFALQLALIYLKSQGITPQASLVNPKYLQLGQAVFRPFQTNDGAYINADASGYQVLVNFRRPSSFPTISMADVLEDKVQPDWLRDRIVLIGSTASSLQDFFYTSYSGGFIQAAQPIAGVELHANFVSQILSAAINGRPLINIWPKPLEVLWIFCWSWLGASLSWRFRSPPLKLILSLFLAGGSLTTGAYLAFIGGYWIPLVPPMLALVGSAVVIIAHLAHLEEELNRSTEFLQTVINTIPDPIFVKDKEQHWIILNPAYCKFIGYLLEELIDKSDYEIFPHHEADVFWQQNELVFLTGKEHENEEEFTDATGVTRLIATKRSLHKDAAGNLFLVGVIRDITERKRSEEELKQKAAELIRSNEELRRSEDTLRRLAYQDPLTGLPNRKQFYKSLSQSLERATIEQQMLALLFLDLDGFKQVNDTLGHHIGDLLLKAVAQRLTSCLRGSDTVSRLGGDEFTVIIPIISRFQDAATVAEKIRETLSQVFFLEGYSISITVSIGISIYPIDCETVEALIKNADKAMYRAKELGRNRFFTHTS